MDTHSYARPHEARVTSVSLDLTADFPNRRLVGRATLVVERAPSAGVIVLDNKGITIHAVTGADGEPLPFTVGPPDPILGSPLEITLPAKAQPIVISYETNPDAAALQWLTPEQTAGGTHPFLYSQGQAILTRTWIPTQDSPGIRQTYSARIVVPEPLRAVMSAESLAPDGIEVPVGRAYEFRLAHPVPPYLFALAIGNIAFRPLSARCGVYAEPPTVDAAADEFADMERMLETAESLLGPYRWGRYDVLVLPPSFPFGGMENPVVTFATPTILAGDRSLVSLVAHELAHSWSGNLVTNATWRDFWLNEGVTTYVERRIMEALYGRRHADMLGVLARAELLEEIERLGGMSSPDTVLYIDLHGRDPDDGATRIPYEKGAALMTLLEQTIGRAEFDRFLRSYFERHAFQSIDTGTFMSLLRGFLDSSPSTHTSENAMVSIVSRLRLDEWVYQPGLPSNAPQESSDALQQVATDARAFASGTKASKLKTAEWTTPEWLHFLGSLPASLTPEQLSDLDAAFAFSSSRNSEILFSWLRLAIRLQYPPSIPAVERFLTSQGRRKFLRPLYEDLMATDWGRPHARRIYARARSSYHAVATATLDEIVR
jgi:leukotriene-A4 hydrolase